MQEMATLGERYATGGNSEIMTVLLTLASQKDPDDVAVEREITRLELRLRGLPQELVFGELRSVIAAMSTLQRLDSGRAVARLYAIASTLANRLSSERSAERISVPRRLDRGSRLLQ
ncbi:MAG: hypothetical protein ACAI38_20300 [Myxococcota bacterium]|nr:hypothetical protein [Myxococcota bacterium]